jgi:two-component system chemotaxis response regulator CheY
MPNSPQVLVVDDSRFERAFLKGMLEDQGWRVIGEAADGQEGVEKFTELAPDVVMMDITMPRMDGITALKEIRRLDPEAQVVIVTAMGSPEKFREALNAGAKDFIVKPFERQKVQEVMSHLYRI